MSLLHGCESVSVVERDCAFVKPIVPSESFEDRWTEDEMRQVVRLNDLYDQLCK